MSDFWWNYKLNEYELRENADLDDKSALNYLPNVDICKTLYKKYRLSGRNIKEAMYEILNLFS